MKAKRYVLVGYDFRAPSGAEGDFRSAHDTLEDAKIALGAVLAAWPGARFDANYVLDLQPDDSPNGMPVVVWTAEDEERS